MANRSWANKGSMWAPHVFPVVLDCNIAIGATGAVGTVNGPGISSVVRLAAGIYKIIFQDDYTKLFGMDSMIKAPVTGSAVAAGSLSAATVYEIVSMGTTTQANWETAGVPAGVTAAVGVPFLCAATSSGTGTAKAIGVSTIESVELVGMPNTVLQNSSPTVGGYVVVKCLGPTAAGNTAPIATDPASGSILFLQFYLGNSSVYVQGE